MNEFERNFFDNSENDEVLNQEFEANPGDMELGERACEPSYIWNSDDFEKKTSSCTSIDKVQPNFDKKVKFSKNMKRYIAIATALAVVNLVALGGIFAVGYGVGAGKLGGEGKKNVIANLHQNDGSTAGLIQTVNKGEELSTVDISKKVGPAVVGITSTVNNIMNIFGGTTTSEGTGSGIIISSDGYIITNNHVIEGASLVNVTLNTGSEYEAKVIGSDSKTDLAVIKIKPDETLTVAELGDSSQIQVGERAIAIGNPLGMEFFGSTTQGIISAINRTINVDNRTMSVIQTDAAINEGNSGGALVNAYGQVIGINTVKIASSSVEGMGFAIPISEAKPIVEDLINYGYVKGRPVLGISARDVTRDMAQRQGWPMGVQVMSTQVGSGAEIAGLEQGDIIFKADGKDVKNFDDLSKIKDAHKPGEVIKLEVYKYETGLNKTISVKLTEERPD
ncbi:MAG: trypsin-like peptidase domain-containing protein [Clostridia bacterium]|nr:trypsin-like peptidase domain-containing protein [Clostridia bacterium]